jgi:hypothetical protein
LGVGRQTEEVLWMAHVRAALLTALRSLVGVTCERSLAANSLKLRFGCVESDKGNAYIWIDPPWRLTLAGQLVTGSADWPGWDGVENPDVNRPLWEAWCALFDPLNRTTLVGVSVGPELPDLRLDFESGHSVETFGNSGDDYWWYYRDRTTGEICEAWAEGLRQIFAKPADA